MGHGDFKLLAALGAWAGYKMLLPIVMVSSLVGAVIGSIWLFAKGRDRATPIPFGPFLAIAGWIVFLFGEPIMAAYWSYFGITPS
jgi:leader peptidase (prepilin peptidase)/N-methyltransferase